MILWLEGQKFNPHNSLCVQQYIYCPWAAFSIPALPIISDALAKMEQETALP